jgi:group I intron endonuclease
MALVYKLTSPSGKVYVGMTSRSIELRFDRHRYAAAWGSDKAIHNAIRKYGADSFTVEVVQDGLTTQEALDLEIVTIDALGSVFPVGYNLTRGGDGCRATPETAAKISAARMGHEVSEATRAKISASNKGRKLSEETRARQSAGQTGRKHAPRSPEHRAKQAEAGRNRSPEYKAKRAATIAAKKGTK